MKFELTEGCMAWGFEVDGKPVENMSTQELKDAILKIADKISKIDVNTSQDTLEFNNKAYRVVHEMVYNFYDDYECSSEPCECCGDWVETYKLEV